MAIATDFSSSGTPVNNISPLTSTWAAKPAAAAASGRIYRMIDVGPGNPGPSGGNFFFSNGIRWKPLNGNCLLDAIDTANSGVANTVEQQLNPNRVAIPAGLIMDYDRLRLLFSASKNGASDSATFRLRFGPLGTVADPVIATIVALAATNQSYGTMLEFKRLSATSLQKQGNADPSMSYNGVSSGVFSAPITVSSMDTNGMYLTISAQMSSGTEIPTVQDYTFELYASDT